MFHVNEDADLLVENVIQNINRIMISVNVSIKNQ